MSVFGARTSALGLVGLSTVTLAAAITVAAVGASNPPPSDSPVASSEPSPIDTSTADSEPAPPTDAATGSSTGLETSTEPSAESSTVPGSVVEVPPSSKAEVPSTSEAAVESSEPVMVLAAAVPAGPTEVVAPSSVVRDITPDGRWVLTSGMNGGATRVDLTTGASAPSPVQGFLTDNGQTVVGVHYDPVSGQRELRRFDFGTGAHQTIDLLPPEWMFSDVTSISGDGRYVAVWASNAIVGDVAVFVLDTLSGTAIRPDELAGNVGMNGSWDARLSADGSVVAFDNADAGVGCTRCIDVWVVRNGAAVLASPSVTGGPSTTGNSLVLDLTADGRFVLFESTATDLVPGVTTSALRYYVRDLDTGETRLLPVPHSERSRVGARISADGRRVVFPLDGEVRYGDMVVRAPLVGVYDLDTGEITQILRSHDGAPLAGGELYMSLAIDATGRVVVFSASIANLVAGGPEGIHAYLMRLLFDSPPPGGTTTTSPGTTAPGNPTAPPTTDPPVNGAGPAARLARQSVRPGDIQTVSAAGFEPGEQVTAVQYSTPVVIGTATADAQGTVTFTWQIRADETPGLHRVLLTGEVSGTVEVTFEVVAAALTGILPATG